MCFQCRTTRDPTQAGLVMVRCGILSISALVFLFGGGGGGGGAQSVLCSVDSQQWVVEYTADAQRLAEAANCTGGTFEVVWTSDVVVEQTIYVVDGTVLNVTGVGSNAVMDGGGTTQLFVVSNASLQLSNMNITNGYADRGGAIDASRSSLTFDWTAFVGNNARFNGGALRVTDGSSVLFSGKTSLVGNNARDGGALYVDTISSVSSTGSTTVAGNNARDAGGALYVTGGSGFAWTGETEVSGNRAFEAGGALYVTGGGSAFWSGDTYFRNNQAGGEGGAVFVLSSGGVGWSGRTEYTSNFAGLDGGALGLQNFDAGANSDDMFLNISGATSFVNNTAGATGGGLAMLGTLSVTFDSADIKFSENAAAVAGGAVSMSSVDFGPVFSGTAFESNFASLGGAVYATGSGTTFTVNSFEKESNPTTFDGCSFQNNVAKVTGGAMDSTSGQEIFVNTLFIGNKAGVGGALRLAGTASLENCSFVNNISDLDGGPAVSNNGIISIMSNISFVGNVFSCEIGEYLFSQNVDNRVSYE